MLYVPKIDPISAFQVTMRKGNTEDLRSWLANTVLFAEKIKTPRRIESIEIRTMQVVGKEMVVALSVRVLGEKRGYAMTLKTDDWVIYRPSQDVLLSLTDVDFRDNYMVAPPK